MKGALWMAMLALAAGLLAGCGGEEEVSPAQMRSPAETRPAAEAEQTVTETVKPMEDYQEEAAGEITEENAEEELDKLEAEIDSDLGTSP